MSSELRAADIPELQVRSIDVQGKRFYSVIDFYALYRNITHAKARNNFHVFSQRMQQNGERIPFLCLLHLESSDKKKYRTACTTLEGLQWLAHRLEVNNSRRHYRLDIRKDDEIQYLHQPVIDYLVKGGLDVKQHVRLPSGVILDIVAAMPDYRFKMIVECKSELSKATFYGAIGQLMCYRNEYDPRATIAIASFEDTISDYVREQCEILDIDLYWVKRQTDEVNYSSGRIL